MRQFVWSVWVRFCSGGSNFNSGFYLCLGLGEEAGDGCIFWEIPFFGNVYHKVKYLFAPRLTVRRVFSC